MNDNPSNFAKYVVMALRPLIFLGLGIYFLMAQPDLGYLSAYVPAYLPGLLCVIYGVVRVFLIGKEYLESEKE